MDSQSNFTQEKVEELKGRLDHVRKENENLRFTVEVMNDHCNVLQTRLQEIRAYYCDFNNSGVKAQLAATNRKTSRILVKTDSKDNSLVVRDGYQWRKYGQKVTKDNPSPRAYFRCSMATSGCPVKKKVQRCMEDKSFLVATYEGQHNHDVHCSFGQFFSSNSPETSMASNFRIPPDQTTNTFGSDITLDLTLSGSSQENKRTWQNIIPESNKLMKKKKIEEYVSSFIKNPNYTIDLAEAVASSITDLPRPTTMLRVSE